MTFVYTHVIISTRHFRPFYINTLLLAVYWTYKMILNYIKFV
ncbi:hypothetical protein ETTORE_0462 [Pseudomonas phage Ettore]|nr:hypothetical protein ETTORE_0462 [Pseudomonas phage Ettore]